MTRTTSQAAAQQGATLHRALSDRSRVRILEILQEAEAIRPGAGSGYVPDPVPEQAEAGALRLAERIRATFDPAGVLV